MTLSNITLFYAIISVNDMDRMQSPNAKTMGYAWGTIVDATKPMVNGSRVT